MILIISDTQIWFFLKIHDDGDVNVNINDESMIRFWGHIWFTSSIPHLLEPTERPDIRPCEAQCSETNFTVTLKWKVKINITTIRSLETLRNIPGGILTTPNDSIDYLLFKMIYSYWKNFWQLAAQIKTQNIYKNLHLQSM